jgi:uncharacterized protein
MKMRISIDDLDDLAWGAALLGTGGGGDPYVGKLMARHAIERWGEVDLVPLEGVEDGWHVVSCGNMGAPTVLIEKIPRGEEPNAALRQYERYVGRSADAIIPMEAGGVNSMIPIVVAAERRLPVIDADGMGRAFPRLEMETFNVYGIPACPVAIADEHGDSVIVDARTAAAAEWLARGVTIRMGGQTSIANYGMDGASAKRVSVPGTMTLAIRIGKTIQRAKKHHTDAFDALIEMFEGTHYGIARRLFSGKIVDLARQTKQGFAIGSVQIEGFGQNSDRLRIRFQNENLIATQGEKVLAIVPDLISILDVDTAEPITTERIRYGQRVVVLGIRVPPIMRTPEALRVFGPRAFGIDLDYFPLC